MWVTTAAWKSPTQGCSNGTLRQSAKELWIIVQDIYSDSTCRLLDTSVFLEALHADLMEEHLEQLVLHAPPNNKNAFKALIVAEFLKVPVKETPGFVLGVTNWTPEFLAMNPLGKVPVLETPNGAIFESNAIARHVCRTRENDGLYGISSLENSQVDQWLDFAACELDANIGSWLYARHGYREYSPQVLYRKQLAIVFQARHVGLSNRQKDPAGYLFLVGGRITLADIVMACTLAVGYRLKGFTTEFMASYPVVQTYFSSLVEQQPPINKYLGGYVNGAGQLPPPSSLR